MFLKHSLSASTSLITPSLSISEDFELIIQSKTNESIQGSILFGYLSQHFQANISISASSIQIQLQNPFSGIIASTPFISINEQGDSTYLSDGNITLSGHQNIAWLLLDVIHLYNLLRLKPGSLLEVYRDVFAFAKAKDNTLVFGKLTLNTRIGRETAKLLAQKCKRKYKYEYSNSQDLLLSIQELITNYPQQLLIQKATLNKLAPTHC